VETGSPQKMRPLKDNQSEFRFHWNGIRSGNGDLLAGSPADKPQARRGGCCNAPNFVARGRRDIFHRARAQERN
jgi:hypothetical protein